MAAAAARGARRRCEKARDGGPGSAAPTRGRPRRQKQQTGRGLLAPQTRRGGVCNLATLAERRTDGRTVGRFDRRYSVRSPSPCSMALAAAAAESSSSARLVPFVMLTLPAAYPLARRGSGGNQRRATPADPCGTLRLGRRFEEAAASLRLRQPKWIVRTSADCLTRAREHSLCFSPAAPRRNRPATAAASAVPIAYTGADALRPAPKWRPAGRDTAPSNE